MSITVVCPSCHSKWKAPDEAANRVLTCFICNFKIPVVCKVGVVKEPRRNQPSKNVENLVVPIRAKPDAVVPRAKAPVEAPVYVPPQPTEANDHLDSDAPPSSTPPLQPARIAGVIMAVVGILFLSGLLIYSLLQTASQDSGTPEPDKGVAEIPPLLSDPKQLSRPPVAGGQETNQGKDEAADQKQLTQPRPGRQHDGADWLRDHVKGTQPRPGRQHDGRRAKEDWALEHLEMLDHPEAALLVRHGSINNLGFGWPRGFDPFSGASTPPHRYPWQANPKAAQGTDRIMVVSSYRGKSPFHPDGYTNTTRRPDNNPVPIPITFTPPKFPIHAAVLQVFVDDFQSPVWKSRFQATMNGWRLPEFEAILNSLNQTGPIGKLVTYQLPAQVVKTLDTGKLTILVDDPTTGAGDGYAFDFFRLLINPRDRKYQGTLTGCVRDEAEGKPIGGATVSAGGVVTTQTAADGTYKLDGVPAGLATVIFSGDCYQRKTMTTDLLAGQIQQVDARLKAVQRKLHLEAEEAFQPKLVNPAEEPRKNPKGKTVEAPKWLDGLRRQ
jgi:hypothetical protein